MLGISSGAKLVVSLVMIVLLGRGISIGSAGMILAAFAGSMISMGFVLMISGKVKKMSMLVICGVMISYICSAITDFVVTFADDANIVNLHNWSMGSFSGTSWENVRVMTAVVFLSLILVFLMAKPIGAYQMGKRTPRTWVEHTAVQGGPDSSVQYSFCLCDCIRRPYILCGNCGSASGEEPV